MEKKSLHVKVAKITSAFLGFEDHDFFTAHLTVDYGDCAQVIGMRVLGVAGGIADAADPPRATKAGCDFIMRMLSACSSRDWADLKGRIIHVLFNGEPVPLDYRPIGIEPLPFNKGERFLFSDFEKRAEYERIVEGNLIKFGMCGGDVRLDETRWIPGWRHDR